MYHDPICTIISFRDIRKKNGIHMRTHEKNQGELLLLTRNTRYIMRQLNGFLSLWIALHIHQIVTHVAYKLIFLNIHAIESRHYCRDHPGMGMIRKILCNSVGHNLISYKFSKSLDFVCNLTVDIENVTSQDSNKRI